MSGELLLEKRGRVLPALALSVLVTAGVVLLCMRYAPRGKSAVLAAGGALLAYVLFRALYPAMESLFPGSRDAGGTWRVTEETLYLNDRAIPRREIRQVYCWPNRNALGQRGTGWTVNLETDRGHTVLRSLTGGAEAERSAAQLRAMVIALGFGAAWREEP